MNWKQLQFASPKQIKALQDKKLRAFIRYKIPYSPLYRELFKEKGLRFSDIKTTDDLTKIPFSSKVDIAPTKEEGGKPRRIILQPNEQLIKQYAGLKEKLALLTKIKTRADLEREYKPIHIHFTTGRTALPTPFTYTAQDIETLKQAGQRMMAITGVTKDDVAINAFPYAPHLAFWQTAFGALATQMLSLNTGGGKILGTKAIIEATESLKGTVLIGMPGYLYHLLKVALETKHNLSSVKYVILGGERVPQGLRLKMKELLTGNGAQTSKILSTYAFTEGKAAWPQCAEGSGYHLYPDLEFIEIVDANGERVAPGERGEVVFTALDWRGSVVLRYKTGDIASLELEQCPHCNRTVPRISIAIERTSEFKELHLTKIKGNLVNLNAFFPLFMEHPGIKEWQIEIRKKDNDPYELDELVVYIAPEAGVNFDDLKQELTERIKAQTQIVPTDMVQLSEVELRERLALETELKEKRIIDTRPKV